jgi:ABC-type branched-subunit amino acid transport system ATPase component
LPSVTHHILRLRGVTVRHRHVVALRDVSVDLPCGHAVANCGPNWVLILLRD